MMDPNGLPPWQLAVLVLSVAFLYSSVGFGGASGYLAAMSLFAISPQLMAGTALILNILVASVAFVTYWRARHFVARLLWPFLLTSVPASFVGGYIQVEDRLYLVLLYLALAYVAFRLIFSDMEGVRQPVQHHSFSWLLVLASGTVIGLLSGMVGLGGGIFLSPLIVLAGWGTSQQAAASSAAFIAVNSASSLLGRWLGGNLVFGMLGASLLPLGLAGAWAGSRLGARYFSASSLHRLLGVVLLMAVVRFCFELLGGG